MHTYDDDLCEDDNTEVCHRLISPKSRYGRRTGKRDHSIP